MTQNEFDNRILANVKKYDVKQNQYPNIIETVNAGVDAKISNNNEISNKKNSNTYIDNVVEHSGGKIKTFNMAPLQNSGEVTEKIEGVLKEMNDE